MPTRNGHRYLDQDWGSIGEVQATSTPRPTDLDRRRTQRVALQASVTYTSEGDQPSSHGEGQLIELSKEGCRIAVKGPIPTGCALKLSINFSDGHPPLSLCGIKVCWREGNTFGVKFAELPEHERQRLQQLIWKFASRKGESDEHTGFRFA